MTLVKQVFVSASAFGAEQVLAQGHAHFVPIVAAAGCAGIEIRRELFPVDQLPSLMELSGAGLSVLSELRQVMERENVACVYSVPMELWQADGWLNRGALVQAMQEARELGASLLKVSLGHYLKGLSDLQELHHVLAEQADEGGLQVTVENDQTPYGGNLVLLWQFFKDCKHQQVPVGMTFDIGNWQWTGEQALQAAMRLRENVVYVHGKHVEPRGEKLITLPLPETRDAAWLELLAVLPSDVPRAIEFPLQGDDLTAVTKRYAELLATADALMGGQSV